ncbi:hypothetical protein [Rhizobium mongolense]|uniref:Uncharacterized protein n=1 Tax=Rhizobium mongolense TaxID=57676 RepID=A0A7W6RSC4_9HYPH|nr:hypothetical protein [Rhizobium mongolense]MBB4277053.1 hypothetical protein [Rhizobium mongolense]
MDRATAIFLISLSAAWMAGVIFAAAILLGRIADRFISKGKGPRR